MGDAQVKVMRAYTYRLKRTRTTRIEMPTTMPPSRLWRLRVRWAMLLDRVLGEPSETGNG